MRKIYDSNKTSNSFNPIMLCHQNTLNLPLRSILQGSTQHQRTSPDSFPSDLWVNLTSLRCKPLILQGMHTFRILFNYSYFKDKPLSERLLRKLTVCVSLVERGVPLFPNQIPTFHHSFTGGEGGWS